MAEPYASHVVVIVPPSPIVSLEEAKAHLRVDHDDDDVLIAAFVAAAIGHIDGPDGWVGRSFGPQTMELRSCGFPTCGSVVVSLPCPPMIDVLSVIYSDASGVDQTLDPDVYGKVGPRGMYPKPGHSWPTTDRVPDAVRIRYRAGYVDSGGAPAIPAPVKAAVLLMTGDLYAHRETVVEGNIARIDMSVTVERLLVPFRIYA